MKLFQEDKQGQNFQNLNLNQFEIVINMMYKIGLHYCGYLANEKSKMYVFSCGLSHPELEKPLLLSHSLPAFSGYDRDASFFLFGGVFHVTYNRSCSEEGKI